MGRKGMGSFQLKAADFRYSIAILCHGKGCLCIRISDISHHKYRIRICLHNFSQKGCSSGFPIGSRNGKYRSLAHTVRQFYLSPHRHTGCLHTLYRRNIKRYSRTHNCQIQSGNHLICQLSQNNFTGGSFWKLPSDCFYFQFFISVIQDNLCLCCFQKLCRTDSADAGAKYQHSFSL